MHRFAAIPIAIVAVASTLAARTGQAEPLATTPVSMPRPQTQAAPSPDNSPPRSTWFLGGNIGFGSIGYSGDLIAQTIADNRYTGLFLELRFGGMLTERLALSVEYWTDGHNFDDTPLEAAAVQDTFGIVITYWALPRLWVSSGLGSSTLSIYESGRSNRNMDGVAIMGAAGYSIFTHTRFVVDASIRLVSSSFQALVNDFGTTTDVHRSSISLTLGVDWR